MVCGRSDKATSYCIFVIESAGWGALALAQDTLKPYHGGVFLCGAWRSMPASFAIYALVSPDSLVNTLGHENSLAPVASFTGI